MAPFRMAFLKVLAAVAWADGTIEEDERNRIKVLFNGFEIDPSHRKDVERLLDHPISFDRAVEITKDFAGTITPPGARKQLLEEIEAMLGHRDDRSSEEAELLEHIRAILDSHTIVDGLVDRFRGLFGRTRFVKRDHDKATSFSPNNVLPRVQELVKAAGGKPPERPAEWNRMALLGILFAKLGRLDQGLNESELAVVEREFSRRFEMSDSLRRALVQVMHEETERETDLQKVCSQYCRVSTMEDRLEVLDALFAVAAADGSISKSEVELLRRMADFLWVSTQEYLGVRDRYRNQIEGSS